MSIVVVKGVIRGGQVEVDEPINLPDGSEVTITGYPHGKFFGLPDNDGGLQGAHGPSLSADGHCLAFSAEGHNAATGPAGDIATTYGYTISGSCPRPVTPADSRWR